MPFVVVQGNGANTYTVPTQMRGARHVAVVYINEPPGSGTAADARRVTVRLQTPAPASMPVAPGVAAAVAQPTAQWTFSPRANNIPHNRLVQALQARLQGAGNNQVEVQPGQNHQLNGVSSVTFVTSACGLDMFDLSARFQRGAQTVTEQLTVVVMKRIRTHYIEMRRGAQAAQGTYSLTSMAGEDILQGAVDHYRRNYGIFLEAIDTTQKPHYNYLTGITQLGNYAAPTAQRNAAAARRVLWIVAADRVRLSAAGGVAAGMAIDHVASVSCRGFEEDLVLYRAIVASWTAYRTWTNTHHQLATEPGWLHWLTTPAGGNNPAADIQRDRNLYLAVKTHGAEALVRRRTLSTLLHEIGHTFGLVPTNSQAAGQAQAGWRDTSHAGHCANCDCTMWWEIETTGGLSWLRSAGTDIDFCQRQTDAGNYTGRCALFLKACDLSNVSHLVP
jgi:hypothetical protein